MFVITPAKHGIPDVGNVRIINAYSVDGKTAFCNLDTDMMRPDWSEIKDPEIIKSLTPIALSGAPTPEELQGKMLANLMVQVAQINAKLSKGATV